MARLILMFNNQVVKEYTIGNGNITIGRNDDNVISVDNLSVSGYHARIDKAGSDFILTDLQSTNGTFLNDKKVVTHKLEHGDNVIIGKHMILFLGTDAAFPEEELLDMDKTMMLDTVKQKELLFKQKKATKLSKKRVEKIGVISFIDSSGLGEVELNKKLTKIGKADTSEIKLSGLLMPATSATISRRPSGYVLSFTGGMAKLKVNGEAVKENIQLKDFDTIELGSYKFQFFQKEREG